MSELNTATKYPDFAGRVAIVTGAAGGIGSEIARMLAQLGCTVAAVDKKKADLMILTKELGAIGLNVAAYPADVSSSTEVELLVRNVENQLGPVHYLVNAAGILRVGKTTELADEDWDATMQVNAYSVFYASRAVARHMIASGNQGAIVTIASNAASVARMHMAAYSASKAAAVMFTKSLGLELAEYGIRCNVVAPGSTNTEMLQTLWGEVDGTAGTLYGSQETFRTGIPLKRIANASQISEVVIFLLSEQASHITMQMLTVDGGATLGA